jgi:threonine/homoserine/homoserine lactone efflux protein
MHCASSRRSRCFKFILAVLFVELTPGLNMAYLATLALARGRTAGLFATIGVVLGLSVHVVVTSLGAGSNVTPTTVHS